MFEADKTVVINGVTIQQKIIPDGTKWQKAASGFSAGSLYKSQMPIKKIKGVTIHNTADLANVSDDAKQYTLATYNQNMGSARVHFYIDELGGWQNLYAGTGLGYDKDYAEIGWHAGDGSTGPGNGGTIAIECIMSGETGLDNDKAKDNTAKVAAWLLYTNNLTINDLYTHNHWMNMPDHIIYGARKNCPIYILPKWEQFKALVNSYLIKLSKTEEEEEDMTQERFNELMNNYLAELAKESATPGWGAEAIAWAQAQGLIQGDDQGRTMAKKFLTRQELATILKRYDEKH